ncbi:hypothetical protein DEO72_LG10g2226 [Vigna unguiculata]|uniref:Uncharacterized protein n=1 Tax=Vigna unguiculata TaxID=3917 RepID=A0A4D6NAY1_VIGUN|nr:hypothetical protein DEO72_LG10g2226 [Vigna unguiculata]
MHYFPQYCFHGVGKFYSGSRNAVVAAHRTVYAVCVVELTTPLSSLSIMPSCTPQAETLTPTRYP